jgi:hypothetical protein
MTDQPPCSATVAHHVVTTIQLIGIYRDAACSRRGRVELINRKGEKLCFCTTHARMAREGKVGPRGVVVCKASRNDIQRYNLHPMHGGEWGDT